MSHEGLLPVTPGAVVKREDEMKILGRLLFPRSPENSGGTGILLINNRPELVKVYREKAFEDFAWEKELVYDEGNLLNVLSVLRKNPSFIPIFDLRGSRPNPEITFQLLQTLDDCFLLSKLIVCGNFSEDANIKEMLPNLDHLDQLCHLKEEKVKNEPNLIREVFESWVYKEKDVVVIDNRWVLNYLENIQILKLFNFELRNSEELKQLNDEFMVNKGNGGLLFFSESFQEIVFRIADAFESENLEYIANSMKDYSTLEQLLFDGVNYSSNKRYREHGAHQFIIALLMDFFLNLKLKPQKKLIDVVIDILREQDDENRFKEFGNHDLEDMRKTGLITCWATALVHDISYPLQAVRTPPLSSEEGKKLIRKFYPGIFVEKPMEGQENGVKESIGDFKKVLPTFLKKLKLGNSLIKQIKKIKNPFSYHSITSAFAFLKCYLEQHNKNQFLCPELTAQSILLHQCLEGTSQSGNGRIDFRKYPIAFMLVLLDEIQDWGRPVFKANKNPNPHQINSSVQLNSIEIKGISEDENNPGEWYLNKDHIEIVLNYENNDKLKEKDALKIKKSKEKNLKRLHIGADNFPSITVLLKFKHLKNPIAININKRD